MCAIELDLEPSSPVAQALQQTRWVTETEAKLKLEVMTIDILKNLLRQGTNLPQSRGEFVHWHMTEHVENLFQHGTL